MARIDFGTVWDRTTDYLADHGGRVITVACAYVFLPEFARSLLGAIAEGRGDSMMMVAALVGVVLAVLGMWGQLVITAGAFAPARTLAQAQGLANRALLPLIGWLLVLALAGALATAPILGALLAAGVDFSAMARGARPDPQAMAALAGYGWAIALYGLVLLAALLWVSARISLLSPVLLEESPASRAAARSLALTRGMVAGLIGVLLLYMLVVIVVSLAVKGVFGAVLALLLPNDGPLSAAALLTALVAGIVAAAFSALAAIFTAKLYAAAVARDPLTLGA